MSLLQRHPASAAVSMDAASGRPLEVRFRDEAWPVTSIDSVRDETAAYPVQSGPRTVFQVSSEGQRFRLVHLHRDQRWTVEPLEAIPAGLTLAA